MRYVLGTAGVLAFFLLLFLSLAVMDEYERKNIAQSVERSRAAERARAERQQTTTAFLPQAGRVTAQPLPQTPMPIPPAVHPPADAATRQDAEVEPTLTRQLELLPAVTVDLGSDVDERVEAELRRQLDSIPADVAKLAPEEFAQPQEVALSVNPAPHVDERVEAELRRQLDSIPADVAKLAPEEFAQPQEVALSVNPEPHVDERVEAELNRLLDLVPVDVAGNVQGQFVQAPEAALDERAVASVNTLPERAPWVDVPAPAETAILGAPGDTTPAIMPSDPPLPVAEEKDAPVAEEKDATVVASVDAVGRAERQPEGRSLDAIVDHGAMIPQEADASSPETPSAAEPAREQQAREFATAYLAAWSSPNAVASNAITHFYGSAVNFYGKQISRERLAQEKSRFMRRWPERDYAHRPGSMEVRCLDDTDVCEVSSTYDYTVGNASAGRRGSGAQQLELKIAFADASPVIIYESGKPIPRRAKPVKAAERGEADAAVEAPRTERPRMPAAEKAHLANRSPLRLPVQKLGQARDEAKDGAPSRVTQRPGRGRAEMSAARPKPARTVDVLFSEPLLIELPRRLRPIFEAF